MTSKLGWADKSGVRAIVSVINNIPENVTDGQYTFAVKKDTSGSLGAIVLDSAKPAMYLIEDDTVPTAMVNFMERHKDFITKINNGSPKTLVVGKVLDNCFDIFYLIRRETVFIDEESIRRILRLSADDKSFRAAPIISWVNLTLDKDTDVCQIMKLYFSTEQTLVIPAVSSNVGVITTTTSHLSFMGFIT